LTTLLISFGIILFVVLIMAVGVIFGRRPLAGGCCDDKERKADCAGCVKHH
jgi:hypothetical protein